MTRLLRASSSTLISRPARNTPGLTSLSVDDQHESIEELKKAIDRKQTELLKKIIRDMTSDYLDILSDKDMVIEELNQLVKDLS